MKPPGSSVVALVFVWCWPGYGSPAVNIGAHQPIFASASHDSHIPAWANDGDASTYWNAPASTGWVEIDLGTPTIVEEVRLLVEQTPPGPTTHVVSVAGENQSFTEVHTFDGTTQSNDWLIVDLQPDLTNVRYVKVTTTASPSWVAWREIEVWGESPTPGDCHDCYFGYYWGAGQHPAFATNHLSEFADHCNFADIKDSDFGVLRQKIKDAQALGMMAVLAPTWYFYSTKAELRADRDAAWETFAGEVEAHTDTILGFYLSDEPYWWDSTCHHTAAAQDNLETVARAIKARFPTKPILVTFAYPCVTAELSIPPSADWISFDRYGTFEPITGYLDLIRSKLHPGQQIILTADGFMASTTSPTFAQQNDWVVRARQYQQLAHSQPDIIGLWTFIWPSFDGNLGVRDIPLLRAEYQRIGSHILNACTSSTMSGCCVQADCVDGDDCTLDRCDVLTRQCRSDAISDCCHDDSDCVDDDVCTQDLCDSTTRRCTHVMSGGCADGPDFDGASGDSDRGDGGADPADPPDPVDGAVSAGDRYAANPGDGYSPGSTIPGCGCGASNSTADGLIAAFAVFAFLRRGRRRMV